MDMFSFLLPQLVWGVNLTKLWMAWKNRHPRQLLVVQENRSLDPTLLEELVKKCQSECLQLLALELRIQEHAQAQLCIVIVCVPTCRLCLKDQFLFVRMVTKIFVWRFFHTMQNKKWSALGLHVYRISICWTSDKEYIFFRISTLKPWPLLQRENEVVGFDKG